MPTSVLEVPNSQHACWSCRRRKQRCDKSLPSCSRCALKLLQCDYAWGEPQAQYSRSPYSTAAAPLMLHQCSSCLDLTVYGARELLRAASEVPVSFYLAQLISEIFKSAEMTITGLLDDYFATIHRHLPILNQENFRSRLVLWPQSGNAGLAILLWALYHVTRRPCPDDDHPMHNLSYRTNKQVFMLQISAGTTLELLQGGLLIAYYECGHGLPQEAHITLANCVTIARLMGLDFEEIGGGPCLTEFSACWWAIVLLDRAVALSCLNDPVPLLLPPSPQSDAEFYLSVIDSKSVYRSFDISSRVALVMGAAVGYANAPRPDQLGLPTYNDMYDQMKNLVQELLHSSKTVQDSHVFCESTLLAFSALIALQIVNPSRESLEIYSKETMHLQSTLRMIQDINRTATHMMSEGYAGKISVMSLCALARAAVMFVSLYGRELPEDDLEMLRFNLRHFGTRWTIGRIYLPELDRVVRVSRPYECHAPSAQFDVHNAADLAQSQG